MTNPTSHHHHHNSSSPGNAAHPTGTFDSTNALVIQASHVLPFPPDKAFETFGDFKRHSEWQENVTSVEYSDSRKFEARWTMESLGIRFGWSTVPTVIEPNKLLVWRSVKGLQLQGRAEFDPLDDGSRTRIFYTLSYVVPKKVKHSLGSTRRESTQLKSMLQKFSDAVEKELQEKNGS
jgi:uncharacterized membrane protein